MAAGNSVRRRLRPVWAAIVLVFAFTLIVGGLVISIVGKDAENHRDRQAHIDCVATNRTRQDAQESFRELLATVQKLLDPFGAESPFVEQFRQNSVVFLAFLDKQFPQRDCG